MKTKPDNARLRRFYALLKQAGVAANKESILAGFNVDSVNDLTNAQIDTICDRLQELAAAKNEASPEIRKARSRVLFLCTDLGVFKGNNWKRLNEFISLPRIAGKLLYDCNLEELKALNAKLSAMLRKRQEEIEAENNKAIKN